MKSCPACKRTYSDDELNFCLEDGTMLTAPGGVLPETVLMNQPRSTYQNAAPASLPGGPNSWETPTQYSVQPKKSSRSWMWVVGILGPAILVCGGGFAAFFAYVASQVDSNSTNGSFASPRTASPTPGSASPEPKDVQTIDLADWVKESSQFGTTEFAGGEFIMGSKQKGFYYVLVAPAEHTTESAATRVTARNINDANTSLGFGLIFHSDPSPLNKDYAFLIDSKRKRFRVVRHDPDNETVVVPWTNAGAIRDGAQENILEARDNPDQVELYVNGELVKAIKNTHGFKDGVAGLYSGDAIKIGFKNLEIRK